MKHVYIFIAPVRLSICVANVYKLINNLRDYKYGCVLINISILTKNHLFYIAILVNIIILMLSVPIS